MGRYLCSRESNDGVELMKKVAIINSIYPFGSTGRICSDMQAFLAQNGFDAMCFHGEGCRSGKSNVRISSLPFKCMNALATRLDDGAGLHSFLATKRLIRMLDAYQPDLFIVHNLHAYYLNIEMFLGYLSKKGLPVIFVLHDCWNFTGHCSYFDFVGCEEWKTGCGSCPQLRAYPASWFVDQSRRNYALKKELFGEIEKKVFVSPSNWLADLARQSFLSPGKIVTINNGIDTNVFRKPISRSGEKRKKTILCVANIWDSRKGIADITKLSALLPNDFHILVVGKTKKPFRLNGKITHIKHTNDAAQLAGLYSSASVFFNPTYQDNYPTVNLEALSCGCPVVCYKVGGACEMLDPQYGVEKGDYQSAFALMKQIVEEENYIFPDTSKFDKKFQYAAYLKIIEDLLEQ